MLSFWRYVLKAPAPAEEAQILSEILVKSSQCLVNK